jgi:hypothetical protein
MRLNFGETVAIEGTLKGFPGGLLPLLVKARTQWTIAPSPNKKTVAFFTTKPEGKKAEKAKTLGVPVITEDEARDVIGPPLKGYRERIEHFVSQRPDYYVDHVFKMGDPVSDAVIARIEKRVGFEVPEAARNLFAELNGLQWFWTYRMDVPPMEGLDWTQTGEFSSEFWRDVKAPDNNFNLGLVCIPDVETIFFSDWHLGANPKDVVGRKVKLGKRKVDAPSFYSNLFGFDFFDTFYPCGLWADPETKDFYIVYGDDHGASWECEPVPLEGYMEALISTDGTDRLVMSGGTKLNGSPYKLLMMSIRWNEVIKARKG